jgi:1,4-dihydroxy-2-naphthoate octaprenyltransferase
VIAFVRLGRPQFLVGGFVLYGLGAALAVVAGAAFDLRRYVWGQAAVTATQLMTHYCNDYFDLAADRANQTPTRWSGGSRVLAGGVLPARVALLAALVLLALAITAVATFAARVPDASLLLPLGAAMIALAWEYSAPPLRLCASGFGELTTAVVVTLLVPVLGYYVQARTIRTPVVLAAALPFLLQFAMLLAIEFPDAAGDAATGKRTLVVRFGPRPAARLYAALTLVGFGMLPLLIPGGLPRAVAVAPLLLAPIALWQAARVARGAYAEPARWESVAFWSVALLIGSAVAELVAAVAAIPR